jgi:glutathione S-transferase
VSRPVLWHIPISHYSEKARWALTFKGIEHERRAPPPPIHMAVALWLTGGAQRTFPVLELDGRRIGDSTAIIAALEREAGGPALYPADPQQLQRALALEEFFDEQLGPHIRLLAWHELYRDPETMEALARQGLPPPLRDVGPASAVATGVASTFVKTRYGVASGERAALAREKVPAALDRLEAELGRGDGEHLVGDAFSVADLTAAALFYPLVDPPKGPALIPAMPAGFEEFRAPLRDRPGYRWVERTYAEHR